MVFLLVSHCVAKAGLSSDLSTLDSQATGPQIYITMPSFASDLSEPNQYRVQAWAPLFYSQCLCQLYFPLVLWEPWKNT